MAIINIKFLKEYKPKDLKNDFSAGLSVAAVSLPQAMAYAMIAGLNPIYGLYTAIVSTIISTFTGISSYMIVGPTNIMAITMANALNTMDIINSSNYLQGILIMTLLTGIFQILIGFLKLGHLVNFISNSVISGLTYGVALIILTGQMIKFLGLKISGGNNVISTLYNIIININKINFYSFLFGLIAIIIIIISKKYSNKLPSYLFAIGLSVILVYIFNLTDKLEVVGALQSTIPKFNLIKFDIKLIFKLLSSSFSLAIISCIQILSIVKMMEKITSEKTKINEEFIGQGITNIICSFFNSFAITGSFTKSYANYEAGAKTKLSQFFSGITVLLVVVMLAQIVKYIPIATLAGIVIYVAFKMFDINEIKKNFFITRFDAIIFTITFLTTILTPRIDYAIYLGIIVSGILVLKDTSELEYSHMSYNSDKNEFTAHKNVKKMKDDNYIIINLTGTMHFNASKCLQKHLNKSYVENKIYIIRTRRILSIDLTVIEELDKFIDKVQASGGTIILSGVSHKLYESLKSYGITDKIEDDNIKFYNKELYLSTKKAIRDANENNC